MNKLVSILAVSLIVSVPVLAQGREQHGGGDRGGHEGGGHIPAHGPAPVRGQGMPHSRIAHSMITRGIRTLPTFTRMISGSGTNRAVMMPGTMSIMHGSTAALRAASAGVTSSASRAVAGIASGLAGSTSALRPPTTTTAMTGSGIATTS